MEKSVSKVCFCICHVWRIIPNNIVFYLPFATDVSIYSVTILNTVVVVIETLFLMQLPIHSQPFQIHFGHMICLKVFYKFILGHLWQCYVNGLFVCYYKQGCFSAYEKAHRCSPLGLVEGQGNYCAADNV